MSREAYVLVKSMEERKAVPSRDDIYHKFGFAAEAAQLLETELGTMLLGYRAIEEGLIGGRDPQRSQAVWNSVNRHTLGQLLQSLKNHTQSLEDLTSLLEMALKCRNRLFHSFYPQHNFRINGEEGRAIMLRDLEGIHTAIFDAYKAVMLLRRINLDELSKSKSIVLPTKHLSI